MQFARSQNHLLDTPNHRSSHTTPTPRGGGVIFVSIWAITILILFYLNIEISSHMLLSILLPTLGASLIGFLSDFYTLSSLWRFLGQVLVAIIFLIFFTKIHLLYLLLAFFGILWSTNLFNFMDGTDGIASVEAIFVLGSGSLLFFLDQHYALSLLSILMVSALMGFLIWNWPKAKIFMGDTGSYTLGFLIAILALMSTKQSALILIWLMFYSVFCFDATVTLLRRIIHREAIFSPHKKHAYQRLHQAGWSHQKILVGLMALNSFLAILAFICLKRPALTLWAAGGVLCCLTGIYYRIEQMCPFKRDQA